MGRYRARTHTGIDSLHTECTPSGAYALDTWSGNIASAYWSDRSIGPFSLSTTVRVQDAINDTTSLPHSRPYNDVYHTKSHAGLSSFVAKSWVGGYINAYAYRTSQCPVACIADSRNYEVNFGPLVVELSDQIRQTNFPGAQLMVTMAELGKTIQMVKNPFGLLKQDWRQRAEHLTARTLAHKGADLWLEGRYGWQSAYYDLQGFATSALRYNRETERHAPADGPSRYSASTSLSVGPSGWFGVGPSILDSSQYGWLMNVANSSTSPSIGPEYAAISAPPRRIDLRVGAFSELYAHRVRTKYEAALDALHMTSKDILPTLWELTPYSFVVDWFVDLQGLAGLLGAKQFLASASCDRLGYSTKSTTEFTPYVWSTYWGFWRYLMWYGTYMGMWQPLVTWDCCPGKLVSYSRVGGLPSTDVLDFFKGLDLSAIHKADGAGLIIQRLHR